MRLLVVPALVAVLSAHGASSLAVALESRATTCYSGVRIFAARGTLETQGQSAQEVYVQKILDTVPDSYATEVVYPAAPFWFPLSFINSVLLGISNAQSQIYTYHKQCPDSKIVLMGYSQGARVMGHAIAGSSLLDLGDDKQPLSIPMEPLCDSVGERVAAVILFGDPGRKLGVGSDAFPVDSCNVSASSPRKDSELVNMLPYSDRLQEWCNKGDPVCCSTGTDLAAHVSYWTANVTAVGTEIVADFVAAKASALPSVLVTSGSNFNISDCIAFNYNPLFTRNAEAYRDHWAMVSGAEGGEL